MASPALAADAAPDRWTPLEMLKYRNFGRKSLTELNKILEERGMHFGMDITKYYNGDE